MLFPGAPRARSWRARLLFAFVAIILAVAAWEAYDVREQFERQEAEVLEGQVRTARALAAALDAVVSDLRADLAFVAHQLARERPGGPHAGAALRQFRPLVRPAEVILVLDRNGRVVAAEPSARRAEVPAGDDAARERVLRQGDDWALSPLVVAAGTQRPGVAMVYALRGPRGQVNGALVAWLEAAGIGDALRLTEMDPETVFAIIDTRGRAVYHSRYADLPLAARDWSASPDVREALAGRAARVPRLTSTSDGVVRMGATVPVPGIGWAVGVFRPRHDALAPVLGAMRRDLLKVGLFVLALGAAAWALAAHTARPLRALQAGADALGAGRLEARVPEDGPDDIARVARAFNAMAARLGEQMTALATANATLEAVLESVPEGLVLAEPEGRIALANPASRLILGRAPTSGDLPVARALAGETFTAAETRIATASGERVLRVAGAPILDDAGRVAGAAIAFEDVTERNRAEAERAVLFARERKARADAEAAQRRAAFLAEASTILASSLDYETTLAAVARLALPDLADWASVHVVGDDGRLERLAAEHVDRAKLPLVHELDRLASRDPEGAAAAPAVVRTGRPELRADVPDSLLVQLARDAEHLRLLRELGLQSYVCVPLVARDRMLGALTFAMAESGRRYGPSDLALVEDLARRAALSIDNARLYREAQSAVAEAQAAVRARDAFLARASHELRTPLTSALGTIRIVRRAMAGAMPEPPEPLLDIANRNLGTMAALINDLLDASKLAAGQERLERQPVEVGPLVASSLEVVGAQARDKGVAVATDLPDRLVVLGDRLKLEQVLVNLLANAVKFTPARGEVRVEAATERGHLVLRVRDTGEGIAGEHLERIFEPFFQAGPRAVRRPRGTGLGLAICRQIVSLHGGTIHAESAGPGAGSTFVVRLPLPSAESRAA